MTDPVSKPTGLTDQQRLSLLADIEASLTRELQRWDGIEELPAIAPQIAQRMRRRVSMILTRHGVCNGR